MYDKYLKKAKALLTIGTALAIVDTILLGITNKR